MIVRRVSADPGFRERSNLEGDRPSHRERTHDVTTSRLRLTRPQILAFRRHVGALDERLPRGRRSLRRAAWAGLQDSMPRAALLSIHARVEGTEPSTWEDPSLVQLWGPRFTRTSSRPVTSRSSRSGDCPTRTAPGRSRRTWPLASTPSSAARTMTYGEAGRRSANPQPAPVRRTDRTVVIRWDGARLPTIWTVPPPEVDPREARLELARRYLHVFGPTTPEAFAAWAGIPARRGHRGVRRAPGGR